MSHNQPWENATMHNNSGLEVPRAAPRGRGARCASQRSLDASSHPAPGVQRVQKLCGVCGDRARSLHFGGLSCDSCKAFFRRAVQSGAFKNFQCPHQAAGSWSQFCVINVASRKSCQKCRFERCVQIGMEVSWVMSEAERQRLLSARLAKRRKLESESPPSSTTSPSHAPLQDYLWPLKTDTVCLEKFMNNTEIASVHEVKTAWIGALQHLPPTPLENMDMNQTVDHALLIRSMAGSIQRFTMFAQPLLESADMLDEDKKALLQGSMLEMCILRGALNYVRGKVLFERYFPARLRDIHCRFVNSLQELALDQTTLLLFLMVILMSPERPALTQPKNIEKLQEYYLLLLSKYINGRYGAAKAVVLYPKLLSKMADLRELSDCHQEQNLLFARDEVHTMKKELHRIQQPDNTFQPPQVCCSDKPGNECQSLPKCTSKLSSIDCIPIEPVMLPMYSSPVKSVPNPQYTSSSSTSPCDSTTQQRFFQQNFTETSPDDLYLTQLEDKDQFSYLCLPLPDVDVMKNVDNVGNRTQDFQTCCFSLPQKNNSQNSRYQLFEPSYINEVLEKDAPSFEECQVLMQQCLQEGQNSGSLLLPPTPSGQAGSYHGFSPEFNLHDDSFFVSSSYHR